MSRKINILQYRKAIISFLLASVAILFFMPGGGKFKYEFNQGELWLHEELNAPFDFPVYKSESELQDEHARVIKQSLNYFVLDSLVVEKQLSLLKERTEHDNRQEFALLKDVFITIYNRGIIDISKFPELKNKFIATVRGNTYEAIPVSELFTQTSANEYVHRAVRRHYHNESQSQSQSFAIHCAQPDFRRSADL